MIPLWSKQILATLGVALALIAITVFNNTVLRTNTSTKNEDAVSVQTSTTLNNYRDSSGSHLFSKEGARITENNNPITEQEQSPSENNTPNSSTNTTSEAGGAVAAETSLQKSLHVYANTLAPNLIDLYTKTADHIATFESLATTTPPTTVHEKAIFLATLYENAASFVGRQNTPTLFSSESTALQKNYQAIAISLRILADKSLQRVTDINALQNYNAAVLASAQAIVSIGTILKKEAVSITPQENGYFFLDLIP